MLDRRSPEPGHDAGFTLIELLVVIIIIGILAAIAIPVFLNQRQKGYDAQAKSDLHNLATLEETYLTDRGVYAGTADLTAYNGYRLSANSSAFAVAAGGGTVNTYKLQVTSGSGVTWCYDSGTAGGSTLYRQTGGAC